MKRGRAKEREVPTPEKIAIIKEEAGLLGVPESKRARLVKEFNNYLKGEYLTYPDVWGRVRPLVLTLKLIELELLLYRLTAKNFQSISSYDDITSRLTEEGYKGVTKDVVVLTLNKVRDDLRSTLSVEVLKSMDGDHTYDRKAPKQKPGE
jgi:hypothetical protein